MDISSYHSFSELKHACNNCKKCPLHEGRRNIVFGEGNENADVLIIGEAPGKNEDEAGSPFIGRAGKQLDELLELAGLSRHDIYITNIIKCRPPNNRNPKAEEINSCSVYLRRQTKFINPNIIVTLGNFASRFILKTEVGITKIHGKPVKAGRLLVFPSFHPAACIYDKKKHDLLCEDFKYLKHIIYGRYDKLIG